MSGGGGGGAVSTGAVAIPPGARKMVQSLKEIVNCTEAEIYNMLRECDMDPDEAVNRLLAQDTFHEVKSKRDKKKEIKELPEPWSRAGNNSSSHASRSGTDRGGHSTSYQITSIDHGGSHGKPTNKKENVTTVASTMSSISESTTVISNSSRQSMVLRSSAPVGTTVQATSSDEYSVPLQPSPAIQNNWQGKSGHISMADIVRMGRPQAKPSNGPAMANGRPYMAQSATMTNTPGHNDKQHSLESENVFHSSLESISQILDINHGSGIAEGQLAAHDGCSIVDEAIMRSTMPETYDASCQSASVSSELDVGVKLNSNPHVEEIRVLENDFCGMMLSAESKPDSLSERQVQFEASGDVALDDDLYQSQTRVFERDEVNDVNVATSTAAANLGQISMHDETSTRVAEPNPAVIIPDHLQIVNAACAQLSFGSFASGTFSGSVASKSLRSNVDLNSAADIKSRADQTDMRAEYYNGEQIKAMSSEGVSSTTVSIMENIDMPSVSHTEVMRNDTLDSTHGLQYKLPSDSYAFSNNMQPSATTYSYPQGNGQMQNLSPFSNLVQPDALQSSLLSQNVSSLRDFDIPFSLLTTQSMAAKYNMEVPSLSGPTLSPLESVKPGIFSQSNVQSLVGANIPTGLAPQQFAAQHHYSQPAVPLNHLANMINYPFLHPNYNYSSPAPSQQAFAGSGAFHQSPAAGPESPDIASKYSLPQYKSSVFATALSQSTASASPYGNFSNSASLSGNLAMNRNAASATTTIGFDGTLGLQYREASPYMPPQQLQNDNPAMWLQGVGSRTMSSLPASNIYNYRGQNQQSAFRQNQQLSQFGAPGYQNYYNLQPGTSMVHQQTPNELNRSRSAQSQPTHQIWQHSY